MNKLHVEFDLEAKDELEEKVFAETPQLYATCLLDILDKVFNDKVSNLKITEKP